MPDFSALLDYGPFIRLPECLPGQTTSPLACYLSHYGLDELRSAHVTVHAGHLDAGDFRLWAQLWTPPRPRGTIFVVHGYFDHLALYRHLLAHLLKQGWQVALWDLPGHGLSSGEPASIDDFGDYVGCLQAFQEYLEVHDLAPHPWFGIGQSTGGSVLATDALMRGSDSRWQGIALLAPLVRPWGWPQSRWLHSMARPFIDSIPRKYRANTNDAAFYEFLSTNDPLQADRLAVKWVSAMRAWIPRLQALPPCSLPTLILQGEQDTTVDWQWNLDVLASKFPNARIHRHPEAQHHLVNEAEPIRTALFAELDAFLDALSPRPELEAPDGRGGAPACHE
ncbi:alpha/beta hydrolase [Cobetia sp. 5-11-6-3]|uniref:alpha/beta hydrolase n=1 Tax=Cobetia sp. 5-11-6-3 TaxID=2737458 RepID=UPI0015969A8F|nr:alpha/beta hydrolase [Cobetia sp. 5-11-6-3]